MEEKQITEDTENTGEVRLPATTCSALWIRKQVWFMRHARPRLGTIYAMTIMPEYGAMGDLVWKYLVYPSDSLCSVSKDHCIELDEGEVFSTKEELLNSL